MNKLLTTILSVLMLASLASCGKDNNGNNDTPDKEPSYKMLYRAILPKSVFDFGNPSLTVYNPTTKQTATVNLTLDQDNRNGSAFAKDYELVCTIMSMQLVPLDPNDFFFYYYEVTNITKDMTYEATIKLNIDETKAAALDQTAKTKVGIPSIATSFYNLSTQKSSPISLALATVTVTNAQALTYYSKPTIAERAISGTVVLP